MKNDTKTTKRKKPSKKKPTVARVLPFTHPDARPAPPGSPVMVRLRKAIEYCKSAIASNDRKVAIVARDELQAAQRDFLRAVVDSAYTADGFYYPIQALSRALDLAPEVSGVITQLTSIIDPPAECERPRSAEVINLLAVRRGLNIARKKGGAL